jgi:hypothetical protein
MRLVTAGSVVDIRETTIQKSLYEKIITLDVEIGHTSFLCVGPMFFIIQMLKASTTQKDLAK